MEIQFTKLAYDQLMYWKTIDKKIYDRIEHLIDAIILDHYHGIGKPEPLKNELSGYWSRRITKEHRLVYKISMGTIIVVACRHHYK